MNPNDMLLTTTATLEGVRITRYLGVVTGETILGSNIIRDFFAGITDVIGGRSAAYERSLQEAKDSSMREMIDQARRMGANAIIGIDLDYESISINNGGTMLMVSTSGTAVVVS